MEVSKVTYPRFFSRVIREHLQKERLTMVVTVVPAQRSDRYQAIKKLCYGPSAIASQVILTRTISNESKLRVSCMVSKGVLGI